MKDAARLGFLLLAILLTSMLAGCQSANVRPRAWGSGGAASGSELKLLGVYQGIVPCADCAGIRMRIAFHGEYADANGELDRRYHLITTYLGTKDGDRTFETEGEWDFERGYEDEPDATVLVLDPDQPDKARRFLKLDQYRIELLDPAGQVIDSKLDYTLERVGD